MATVQFDGGVSVSEDDLDKTLLQISLDHGVPHTHACGGIGRCSTCRVLILDGKDYVAPQERLEADMACQKGLSPEVRLACQTRITGDVTVRRLVHDEIDQSMAVDQTGMEPAREMDLAILFCDIRGFTPMVERHLPYDVVHMLNRYFRSTGQAILDHDGFIDKYIGDAVMALFGLDGRAPTLACQDAILAARDLVARLDTLNGYVSQHFEETLRCGVGIHFGRVVVGQIGHPNQMQFTAIGDPVNVASRIESVTKAAGVQILASDAVRNHAPDLVCKNRKVETQLKGKSGSFDLFAVPTELELHLQG